MKSKATCDINKKEANVYTLAKKCGCIGTYTYKNCTNQDLIHEGCIESCECFKYIVTVEKCKSCKSCNLQHVNIPIVDIA